MRRSVVPGLFCCLLLSAAHGVPVHAAELHEQVDAFIAAKAAGPVSGQTGDAEFLRRVTLDFAGRIPTADETRAFLADADPGKRVRVIDQLLAGPDYPRRMREQFHVMLMERNGDHPEWTKFLEASFAQNKHWDQLTREILAPNPDDENLRGAAFFWTKRLEHYGQNPVDLPGLTRDVGRLFLGRDFQCAQCHDHLFIDEYKQADFQGLFTFVSHTSIRTDTQFPAVAEGLVQKKTDFMSVFVKVPLTTGPRLPGGTEFEIPVLAKGEEFAVAPDRAKNFPGVPKFSPLKILSEQLPRGEHPAFARNIANRLWFVMFGRGLVHPLDLHHGQNPPSHPEVLDLLARELAAHQFDIKWLLRELALTQAYQRSSVLPDGVDELPPERFAVFIEKPLSAEQLLRGLLQATGELPRVLATTAPAPADGKPAPTELDQLQQKFVGAFANPAREPETEFSPSVKAALFLLNDGTVLGWLNPREGNLADRLIKQTEPAPLADELYLNVLSRTPTDDERAGVSAYLARWPDQRPKAIGQMIWALLASTEFCMNH